MRRHVTSTSDLRGWLQYFRIGASKKTLGSHDFWVRRHLRCMLWRQWKQPVTRFKRLLGMGCPKHQALLAYLAKIDWRDLLSAADFADDPNAHSRWSPK